MTVSTTTNSQSYAGSGTSPFNFPYKFFADTDLIVTRRTSAGVLTTLVLNTDYTVTGAGSESGGTVTPTASETGNTITVTRQLPRTQGVDYSDLGPFPAEATETALDRLIMLMQEVYERSGNGLRIPTGGVNYDAGSLKIENLANAVNLTDAANLANVQAAIAAMGNVPSPIASQIGFLLQATATGTFAWFGSTSNAASAATVDLAATTTRQVVITGSTTISSFGVPSNTSDFRFVRFTSALTLTHDGNLISLPGGANITTAAEDLAIFVSRGGTGWRCYCYMKANGKAIINPAAADISDSTPPGRALLTAASQNAQLIALGIEGNARYAAGCDLYGYSDFNTPSPTSNDGGISFVAVSSGTGVVVTGMDSVKHPGVMRIVSAAGANSGGMFRNNIGAICLNGGGVFDCIFYVNSFANGTFRMGFHDSVTNADATNGCYIEFGASGVPVGKTANAGTRTTSANITAGLSASTWYHARITVNAAVNSVTFEIFDDAGTLLGTQTVTTNLPADTTQLHCCCIATESVGATQNLIVLDLMGYKLNRAVTRGAFT